MSDDNEKYTNSSMNNINDPDDNDFRFNAGMDRFERKLKRNLARKMLKYSYKYQYKNGRKNHPASVPMPEQYFENTVSKLTWEEYKNRVIKIADNAKVGLAGHLSSFIAVNVGLLVLNMLTSAQYPWFFYPLGGWGIGMFCHLAVYYMHQRRKKEVEKRNELPKEAVPVFNRLWASAGAFFNHVAAFLSVNSYLFMINMITSREFLWSAIPAGIWGVGLFIHFTVFKTRKGILKKRLKEIMEKGGAFFSAGKKTKNSSADPLMTEAENLKESILSEINTYGKTSPVDSDMKPVLENFMKQLSDLNSRYREINNLVQSVPMNDLESDLVELKKKAETAKSPYMKTEYEKSIREIEQHKHSFEELTNQKEIIELRLKSSMNHLKQMKIDLARMKGMMVGSDNASVSILKERTKELSNYLDDLRQGFTELDQEKEEK